MAARLKAQADIRELVRDRYADAARAVGAGASASCTPASAAAKAGGCGCAADPIAQAQGLTGACGELYSAEGRDALPAEAQLVSLGCGNPTAVAELRPGETVLDLGSGGGIDVLLCARRVGPAGKAYGLDMTDEMLELARENQHRARASNVEWLRGNIEEIPLADSSVDVVISNCVINLSGDKPSVFAEAARVLRPGGRLAVTDVIADPDMDEATRRDMAQWTGCIAGALTAAEFRAELHAAGFIDPDVRETHRVHRSAGSAIIRARKPSAPTQGGG